jgi:hypothetical protein
MREREVNVMQLSSIARASAFAGILVACGAGGSGTVVTDDPAGPFSGQGHPGPSIYDNPGPFTGSGAPGPAGSTDATSLIAKVCERAGQVCPQTSVPLCIANFQSNWDELTTDCARHAYYAFLTCLLGASFTCGDNGQAGTQSCLAPSLSQCGGGSSTGGTGGGGGSTGGSGGTGGNDTGGAGGSGGTGGSTGGAGGSTGGSGGSTGGSGGSTGGTGGSGGRGGRGGTAGGPRDGGRG